MNYEQLESAIRSVIRENGNEEITGDILQATLLAIVGSLGTGYQFIGVADAETEPGTPDQKVFYLRYGDAATLANFGDLSVPEGLSVISWTTSWAATSVMPKAGSPDFMLPVTWAELKALRDAGELVAGMKYRITDYVATTLQEDTRSANHPFDIIVVADSVDTLNENATAIQHEGDTYFANSNLAAWKLKYCLDNDTERFEWADNRLLPAWIANPHILDGEHLPYQGMHTVDSYEEYGEVPIYGTPEQAVRYWEEEGVIGWCCWNINDDMPSYPSSTATSMNLLSSSYIGVEIVNDAEFAPNAPGSGKGVVYWMQDEFNNEAPFDFKGILFRRFNLNAEDIIIWDEIAGTAQAELVTAMAYFIRELGGKAFTGTLMSGADVAEWGSFIDRNGDSVDVNEEDFYMPLDDPDIEGDPGIFCPVGSEIWHYLFNFTNGDSSRVGRVKRVVIEKGPFGNFMPNNLIEAGHDVTAKGLDGSYFTTIENTFIGGYCRHLSSTRCNNVTIDSADVYNVFMFSSSRLRVSAGVLWTSYFVGLSNTQFLGGTVTVSDFHTGVVSFSNCKFEGDFIEVKFAGDNNFISCFFEGEFEQVTFDGSDHEQGNLRNYYIFTVKSGTTLNLETVNSHAPLFAGSDGGNNVIGNIFTQL